MGAKRGNRHAAINDERNLTSFLHIKALPEEKGKWVRASRALNQKLAPSVRDALNQWADNVLNPGGNGDTNTND